MKVFLRAFKNLALSCLILSVVGCASVTSSTSQVVSVNTVYKGGAISGAKCSLTNDKGSWFATTPGEATIQKKLRRSGCYLQKTEYPDRHIHIPFKRNG